MNTGKKRTVALVLSLALALLTALAVGGTIGGRSALAARPQGTALGTAFTYQGRLTDTGGNPIAGPCNLRFTLYESAAGADQVGTPQTKSGVTLNDGYFTVDLDFGADAFTGEGRFLKIEVDCGSGYTTLSPRVKLTPAPYALALPGLWTQPNATSPNVIGGYSGNSVDAGVTGATIGGGGESGAGNRVTANYGTVGGGYDNTASGVEATVGGGRINSANGEQATVAGGFSNIANGNAAAVGGGQSNHATGSYTTISGGSGNTSSAYAATVGGGESNTASNDRATVGGGESNMASGYASTVGGGYDNTASSSYSTISGGTRNIANGDTATVPGGNGARASLIGQWAYANGTFTDSAGEAQASLYVMRGQTTSTGTWENLYLDLGHRLTIPPTRTLTFDILVVGRSNAAGGNESAGYYCWGVIENVGGTTTLVGSWCNTLGEDDSNWDVRVVADDSKDALAVQVMGNGETIRWVATVRTAEVSW